MYQYILPDAGEGTHESAIMSWAANVGDKVEEDQTLLEIESDKAVVELPSPITGYLAKIYVEAGDTGIVGQPIADIAETEEELNAVLKGGGQDATMDDSKKESPVPATDLSQKDLDQETPQAQEQDQPSPATEKKEAAKNDQPKEEKDIRSLAIPRVRRYARTKNVDLLQVTGTGKHGRISMEDVDAFIANGGAETKTSVATQILQPVDSTLSQSKKEVEPETEQPSESQDTKHDHKGKSNHEEFAEVVEKMPSIRRTIADALAKSSSQVAQVTVFDQVEVDALVAHRNRMKVLAADRDIKLTFTSYLVKALVAMLKRFPDLNVSLDMDKNEISHHQYYNIGVATDTPRGLMVPMIRHAERKSLFDIAEEIADISQKARDGKISNADMGKGSISVTNVGAAATAGVWSTPIINLPEIAILNVGRIDKVFMPDQEGNPVLKNVMKISFAFDHRAIDGVYAQKAINLLKSYLNDPDLLLAEG
ncbi:dihydrolipoamide acetyltransferase family protein [Streptococcus catagoni]|uniref:dihydrolipoamide acetyltransferase family protein n=1 Tax=Streptococcus catagoni TaxID=2654874 RepID=UPI001408AEE9|nr:dihydrolipoamide acetyltransferase family protein [Streptococcus catagoni]